MRFHLLYCFSEIWYHWYLHFFVLIEGLYMSMTCFYFYIEENVLFSFPVLTPYVSLGPYIDIFH